jgi:hypothetical protein
MVVVGMLTGSLAVLFTIGTCTFCSVTEVSGLFFNISDGVDLGRVFGSDDGASFGDELRTLLRLLSFCSGDGARYRYALGWIIMTTHRREPRQPYNFQMSLRPEFARGETS